MQIIGVHLHARPETIAMLDTETGEMVEKTLEHEGQNVREFYFALPGPVLVGIEATGSMLWFLQLMEDLGIDCRVRHPAKIRKAETRRQKYNRRDAELLLKLLVENRFPSIWMPSTEQRDLRALLRHRQRLGALSKQGNALLRHLWCEAAMKAVAQDPELKRFYRRKRVSKGRGKAKVAAARKLAIRLWIMLRDEIDYQEFCRRGQLWQKSAGARAGRPDCNSGPTAP